MQGRRLIDERLLEEAIILEGDTQGLKQIDSRLKDDISKTREEIARAFSNRATAEVTLVQ